MDAAAAAGVRKIMYLSFVGARSDSSFTLGRDHWATEERIRRAGVAWTFPRMNFYLDFLPLMADPDGVIEGPAGDGRAALVTRDDVADVIAELLVRGGHDGETHDITGPEALTLGDAAARLSAATGRRYAFRHQTVPEAYASRAVHGAPDWQLDAWVSTYTAIANGDVGENAFAVKEDVSTANGALEAVGKTLQKFGKLDILINNAGVLPSPAEIGEFPEDEFERVLHINVKAPYYMTRAAVPHLEKTRGNIVNAGSEAGLVGEPKIAAYSGTKGFILAFTRTMAMELVTKGIRVNAIAPGPIDTQMTDPKLGTVNQQFGKEIETGTPMGRRGTVEEVAYGYLYLASEEASYVTGTTLSVDGGSAVGKGALGEKVPDKLKQPPAVDLPLDHTKRRDIHEDEYAGVK